MELESEKPAGRRKRTGKKKLPHLKKIGMVNTSAALDQDGSFQTLQRLRGRATRERKVPGKEKQQANL